MGKLDQQITKKKIYNLISSYQIEDAISLLISSIEDQSTETSLYHEALIVSANYFRLKRLYRDGSLDYDFYHRHMNDVIRKLLIISERSFEQDGYMP